MVQLLPPELWLEIFRLVTVSELDLNTTAYRPFHLNTTSTIFTKPTLIDAPDAAIKVKRNLALVCRTWRDLTASFLYENISIHRGSHALLDTLVNNESYRKLVRRVVLPYRSTVTTSYQISPHPPVEILKHCTNLETLVRPRLIDPEPLEFHFDAEALGFDSLRRLDWWYHTEAERSGGINSLSAVLQRSPNLQYLSVRGVAGYTHFTSKSKPLTLSKLHTLRLDSGNGLFLRNLADHWSLPALTTVVVDFPLAQLGLSHIWETYGTQLRTVEFGKHGRFLLDDHITGCLRGCPNLRELNFFLFFTMVPTPDEEYCHPSISTIGIHAEVNQQFQNGAYLRDHIQKHFEVLKGRTFPALKEVILHGDWRSIMSHIPLAPMWQSLRDCRFTVVAAGR